MEQRRLTLPTLPVGAWILVATALNLILATSAGYLYDNQAWASWTATLQHGGYAALSADYPPIFVHWLWLCGKLLDLFHQPAQAGTLLHLLVNTPVLACHAGLLLLVDRAQRPLPAEQRLPWLLPFVALNPALLVDGPMWGQVDLVYSLMLAGALQLLLSGRALALVMPLLVAALLTRFQSICILPVVAPLLWRRRSPALWAGLLLSLLLADLVLLPYWLSGSAMRMFQGAYLHVADHTANASLDAWNLWFLLGLNHVNDSLFLLKPSEYPAFLVQMSAPRLAGEILFLAWSLWLLISTWRGAEPQRLWRNALFSACGFFLLLPDMHQRDLFAAVPLALLAAAAIAGFGRHALALSVLAALNMLFVLGMQQDGPVPYLLSLALLLYIGAWAAWPWRHHLERLPRLPWLRQHLEKLPLWGWLGLSALLWALILVLRLASAAPQSNAATPWPPVVDGWMDITQIPGISATQGWGTLHIGQSVEGNGLHVAGQSAEHGFGTHAQSQMDVPIPPGARRFTVSAGLDDEASGGRLEFKVYLDGQEAWSSGAMVNGDAPRTLDLDVSGHHQMQLVVDSLGEMDYDHADWLEPRFRIMP